MSFPRYEKYKDSGVEGLGEVPEHWRIMAIKRFSTLQRGHDLTDTERTEGLYPVVTSGGISGTHGSFMACGPGVVTGRYGSTGRIFYIKENFWPHNTSLYLSDFHGNVPRFVWYALQTVDFAAHSAKAAVPGIDRNDIHVLNCIVPSQDEQSAISSFLDRETAKIDALVGEQQRLIELLNEKRQAVISQTVTKGLNLHAPMKPSGIEWIGDVPEHWEIRRGRFLFRKLDLLPETEDGVVTAFRDGQVTLRENRRTDGFTMAVLEFGYQRVRAGDLVIHGMDAFAGAIGVSESTGKCTPEYAVLTPARGGIDNSYYAALLRLMALRNYIYVICPSVRERAPRFRFEAFKDVSLPLPPFEEQTCIMQAIQGENSKIGALTAEARRAIDLLQERRTALILAAVTGKIDVRGLAESEAA